MANNLVNFNPFRDIARFDPFGGFDDLAENFDFKPMLRYMNAPSFMRVDVSETDDAYLVKAEIPGVKKEDIDVDISGNKVSIKAESKQEKEEKEGSRVIRSERYQGEQYRSFTLGQEVDSAKADAKYQNGVLTLSLPKKHNGSAKKLEVH